MKNNITTIMTGTTPRSTRRSLATRVGLLTIVCAGMLVLSNSHANAQSVAGRIAFGFDAGGNKFYSNYTDDQFAIQGDAFIRWNILDWFSLHAAYNAGELKYKATAASLVNSGGDGIGTINHTRVGGWELMGSFNVFPSQTFVPYFIAGLEALNFQPNDANDVPLKNNAAAAYAKNVIGGVLGVGYEMYVSDKVTFNGKVLLHMTGTDWLDDYSNPKNYRQDAFMTFGVGFAYYIFAPDVDQAKERTRMNGDQGTSYIQHDTHDITSTTIIHNDTIYVHSLKDTIYLTNPKVNTIIDFPGELFVVNTDHFNEAIANNQGNLYDMKRLIQQCPGMRVEIQGYASEEGTPARNQELSELRPIAVKKWLTDNGVSETQIVGTVGYGTAYPKVAEVGSQSQIDNARTQNRRVAIKIIQTCE